VSEEALTLIEAVRREMMELPVQCSWCERDKVCKNADHLFAHVLMRHPEHAPEIR
jgi:hypothetical protein